jgi:glycosyltransferase involved in cell wall biosynthesis
MLFRLPPPLKLEELQRKTPAIEPVSSTVSRPFWSVIIPTYNRPAFFKKALESVLSQDPGPDQMEIIVADNCSSVGNAQQIVKELAWDRVTFYRHDANIGGTENQNFGLKKSCGRWIHILHDDDLLMPGFYDAYRGIIESNKDFVMIQGRVIHIDEKDRWLGVVGPMPTGSDYLLRDYHLEIAAGDNAHTCAGVVKRDVYEKIGGLAFLEYCPDWDLRVRIAQIGAVGGTRRPYVMIRMHRQNDTFNYMVEGKNIISACLQHELNIKRIGVDPKKDRRFRWRTNVANSAEVISWQMDEIGLTHGRLVQANLAFVIEPNVRRFTHLLKSWLKHKTKARATASNNGH